MLHLVVPTVLTLIVLQSQSGRSFRRVSRLPVTEAATQIVETVEASTSRQDRLPLVRMRSGRAWSRFHHSRLPRTNTPQGEVNVVDASTTERSERRGYWGQPR